MLKLVLTTDRRLPMPEVTACLEAVYQASCGIGRPSAACTNIEPDLQYSYVHPAAASCQATYTVLASTGFDGDDSDYDLPADCFKTTLLPLCAGDTQFCPEALLRLGGYALKAKFGGDLWLICYATEELLPLADSF
jgi:hypothetical protein